MNQWVRSARAAGVNFRTHVDFARSCAKSESFGSAVSGGICAVYAIFLRKHELWQGVIV
jgi:hypothetical protein